MIRYEPMGLRWKRMTLRTGSMPEHALSSHIEKRLGQILASWEGTRYVPGQRCRQVGVDCVRFVSAVLDELYHRPVATECPELPQDISMHNRRGALGGLRSFLRSYPEHERVFDGWVEPGDIIVSGPPQGGPGHAIIVGPMENTVWQASSPCVHYTGLYVASEFQTVFAVYRLLDRHLWV